MNRRAAIGVASIASAALLLTGCTGGGGGGGGDESVELSYLSWETEEIMTPVIEDFEAENPGITINASYAPPVNDYIQALQTRILSGTAPDVFIIAAENKTNLIDNDAVLDLTDEPWVSVMPPFNAEAYGRDGKVYGLSVASWGAGVYYNQALLEQVGYDTVPQDWEGFLQLCADLKAAGITPFLEAVDGIPFFVQAFLGAHDEATGGDMDQRIFSGEATFEEEWTPVLEQYVRLYDEGLVTRDTVGLTGDQVITEFANGNVAMIPQGPWFIGQMRENPDLEFAITPVPALPGTDPSVAGAAGVGYSISPTSEHVEEAKTFLDYLASERSVEVYQTASNAITVTNNYTPELDPALDPILPAIVDGHVYLAQIAWERDQDILNVEATAQVQLLVAGQVSPAEMAAALDKKLAEAG